MFQNPILTAKNETKPMNLALFTTFSPMLLAAIKTSLEVAYTLCCVAFLATLPNIQMSIHPIWLFIGCTIISMIAGQASLWRGDKNITTKQVVSHLLNMGTCGAALSMIAYATLGPRPNLEWYILGFCGLFSLGGMPMIEMATQSVGGFLKRVTGKDEQ